MKIRTDGGMLVLVKSVISCAALDQKGVMERLDFIEKHNESCKGR